VTSRLAAELPDLTLTRALQRASLPASPEETSAELARIVTDLFHPLARHKVAIKLVDQCAPELLELARVWFETWRSTEIPAMDGYLDARQRAGLLTMPGPNPHRVRTIVARGGMSAVGQPRGGHFGRRVMRARMPDVRDRASVRSSA
jgi:hypothetical protein